MPISDAFIKRVTADLPTWEQCKELLHSSHSASALVSFIHENEPSAGANPATQQDDDKFCRELVAVLCEAYQQAFALGTTSVANLLETQGYRSSSTPPHHRLEADMDPDIVRRLYARAIRDLTL